MKRIIRIIFKTLLFLLGALLLIVFVYIFPWLWRSWVTYPKLEKERTEIRSQHKKPQSRIEKTAYKGILHMHSYWSHDSRGVLKEILPAAKQADMDFLFFADHKRNEQDTFPRSFKGMYDGILFEPGTESSQGLIVNPLDSVVLDWSIPQEEIIKQVVGSGGLAYYCHTEDPHEWDNPDYQAMEIYNIHTDLLDEEGSILPLIINFAINGKKYSHWAMREIFDEQTEILARWDKLNLQRRITGVGAADAHNNQNVRARYNEAGMVEWIGPNADLLATVEPGWKENLLLSDEPDEAGWSFRFETDSYFTSFNYINTHVFCDTLASRNIKDNLVSGHAFIAFENLANARGFEYFSENGEGLVNAIIGDSVSVGEVKSLDVISPYPAYYKMVKDGEVLEFSEQADYSYSFKTNGVKGNYRIEAYFKIDGELLQWVLTNPIYLHE